MKSWDSEWGLKSDNNSGVSDVGWEQVPENQNSQNNKDHNCLLCCAYKVSVSGGRSEHSGLVIFASRAITHTDVHMHTFPSPTFLHYYLHILDFNVPSTTWGNMWTILKSYMEKEKH